MVASCALRVARDIIGSMTPSSRNAQRATRNFRLGIIGGGRAAWAFGSTWRRIGWPLTGIALRSDAPIARLLDTEKRSAQELAAESELILVAVSDRSIAEVAESIPQTPAIIFHPSGIA